MENYIENSYLITAYLKNTLSEIDKQAFEKRLETDLEFNAQYLDQLAILEGIKRTNLKSEINAAKQSYVRAKWLKYIVVSIGVILLSALIYSFVFKTEKSQVVESTNNEIEMVSDSIVVKKPSEEKIKKPVLAEKQIDTTKNKFAVVKRITKAVEDKELTKAYSGVIYMREVETLESLGNYSHQEFDIAFPKLKHLKPKNDTIFIDTKIVESKFGSEEFILEEKLIKNEELVEPEPMPQELISFYKSVKKSPQIIEVNTEKDFTVTCKEGTKLTIPAKSFVDANTGKLARGTINLEVTEYYKLSDMLLGNLTTKSDDKQLETGGMLYLDANKKGKKLKLKSGKRIKMAFNNKGKKNMELFTGEESSEGVNWRLKNNNLEAVSLNAVGFKDDEIIEEDVTIAFQFIESVPIYPGCENKTNDESRQCMSDAIDKLIKRKFNINIAEDLGLTGKQRIYTNFEIDKEGNIGKITVRAPAKELGDETIRILELVPQLIPGRQKNKPVKTTYNLVFTISLEGETVREINTVTVKSDKKFTETFEKKIDSVKTTNGIYTTISNNDIQRYAFSTANLGWINCDRFVNSKKGRVKFKLKIKDPNGTNVKMIFKSISSILPSKKFVDEFDFGLLPIDEEVVLIAIKKTKDKLFLAKKEMITKRNPDLNLDFKEVTIQELKSELEALNSSF